MSNTNIIHQGEDNYKRTDEFLKKELAIRQQINLKFKTLINTEKNVLKRIKLSLRKQTELRKALSQLNSKDILFLTGTNN